MIEITFERVALYEEVWSTPLTQLAKKYGRSDNGIRKVCKAMNIPLPAQGHWAKVAAGKEMPKAALPPDAERTRFTSRLQPAESSSGTADDEAWLSERIAFEEDAENGIIVDLKPARWHPAMILLRDGLRDAVKALPKAKRDAERAPRNPNAWREPDFAGAGWKHFVDGGKILMVTHRSSPMRVSPLGYERALAIFNTLCFEAQRREFTVAMDDKEGRLVLDGFEGRVEIRISERLDEAWRKEVRWDKKLENVKYKVPTGELRLYVGRSYREREVADRKEARLEEQLSEVFIKAWRHVVYCRVETRQREEWHRQWEEEERRRQEETTRRKEAEARRARLLEDAASWQKANALRQYLAHVEASRDGRFDAEWLAWAREVADSLDPLTNTRP